MYTLEDFTILLGVAVAMSGAGAAVVSRTMAESLRGTGCFAVPLTPVPLGVLPLGTTEGRDIREDILRAVPALCSVVSFFRSSFLGDPACRKERSDLSGKRADAARERFGLSFTAAPNPAIFGINRAATFGVVLRAERFGWVIRRCGRGALSAGSTGVLKCDVFARISANLEEGRVLAWRRGGCGAAAGSFCLGFTTVQ